MEKKRKKKPGSIYLRMPRLVHAWKQCISGAVFHVIEAPILMKREITKGLIPILFILPFIVFSGLCFGNETPNFLELWEKRTAGKNLALGKKVSFTVLPNYPLTQKGNRDDFDLTDGVLSSREDGAIWFDKSAVGWGSNLSQGIDIRLDLGAVYPVSRVVLRCLAGKAQADLSIPEDFELFVSKDGEKWYSATKLKRLMHGEQDLSDFKTCFYLPQTGISYVYPMELSANCHARFLNITIRSPERYFMADELAVMEASEQTASDPGFDSVYAKGAVPLYQSGILVSPYKPYFAISENVITPNFLLVRDLRASSEQVDNEIRLAMELPTGIKLISPTGVKTENLEIGGKAYTRWIVPFNIARASKSPLFFQCTDLYSKHQDDVAIFYAIAGNNQPNRVTVPLHIITIPEVPNIRFHTSLVWTIYLMDDSCSYSISNRHYPEFFTSWSKMGFNTLGVDPWLWLGNQELMLSQKKSLTKARHHDFKIIMLYSPGHIMQRFAGEHREIYTQDENGKSSNLCPAYRGKYYQEELQRIKECIDMTRPDYIFWDIECWHDAHKDAAICARCLAGQKASQQSMQEYLLNLGTEIIGDLYRAVEQQTQNLGMKMPIVASYDRSANKPIYAIEAVERIYPQYIKQLQPSLYVAGSAQKIHDSIRKNYQQYGSRSIIPWLTAGTYGEYESYKLEQMIYEAMLNGAGGFTYYCYQDFDTPTDFYYHAKALKTLAPYQELIMDGEVLKPEGSNKNLTYSGIRKGDEMILLVGNYIRCDPKTVFNAPYNQVEEVKDLLNGSTMENNQQIKLTVPKEKVALIYIKGR